MRNIQSLRYNATAVRKHVWTHPARGVSKCGECGVPYDGKNIAQECKGKSV